MRTSASDIPTTPAWEQAPDARESAQLNLPIAITQRLQSIVANSGSFDSVLQQLAQLVSSATACLDVWICKKDAQGRFRALTSLLESSGEMRSAIAEALDGLCDQIQHTQAAQTIALEYGKPRILIGAPIRVRPADDPMELIWVSCLELKAAPVVDPVWLNLIAAEYATQWVQTRTWMRSEQARRSQDDVLKTGLELAASRTVEQAARILVNSLRRLTGAEHVAITIDGSLAAVSDLEQVDQRSESARLIKTAIHVGMESGQTTSFATTIGSVAPHQLPLQAFCRELGFESCSSLPLAIPSNGTKRQAIGLLIAGKGERFSEQASFELWEDQIRSWGQHFELALRAHRTLPKIAKDWTFSLIRHRWRKIILAAVVGLLGVLAIPLPYRIQCDCELQPVSKRFVVAPFESILERSFVKNGDIVSKDQVLAQLDGRQLRIELAGLQAEWAGAKKKHDSELAAGNIAPSQIAKSEMERLKAKINLFQSRTEMLEIRSPIDGVVVLGDLDKAEGASLTIGQALFEIAPLDQMYIEVAIPESEIAYVKGEMPVTAKLNAFPYTTWEAKIQSIHPSGEIVDEESVFIAQALIGNEDGLLRPGMKGKAKIKSQWAPLGWSLFHRPWEAVRYWTVW